MKVWLLCLVGAVLYFSPGTAAFSRTQEVIVLRFGDYRFDQLSLEKIIKIKNITGKSLRCELYFQDGSKLVVLYGPREHITRKILYRTSHKPDEVVYFNNQTIPVKAVFFSYTNRTKTTILFTRDGYYKREIISRL